MEAVGHLFRRLRVAIDPQGSILEEGYNVSLNGEERMLRHRRSCAGMVGCAAAGALLVCMVGAAVKMHGHPSAASTAPMPYTLVQYEQIMRLLERRANETVKHTGDANMRGNALKTLSMDAVVTKKGPYDANRRAVVVSFNSAEGLQQWNHTTFETLAAEMGISRKEWRVESAKTSDGDVLSGMPSTDNVTFPYPVTFLFKKRGVPTMRTMPTVRARQSVDQPTAVNCPPESLYVGSRANFSNCGLEKCERRYYEEHAEACRNKCRATTRCEAFTWLPQDEQGRHVCTLFASPEPDQPAQPSGHTMCKLQSCFETGVQYSPPDMKGQRKSKEHTAWECQVRCQVTMGCEHFSYWPDGSCRLQDADAMKGEGGEKTITGPPTCAQWGIE